MKKFVLKVLILICNPYWNFGQTQQLPLGLLVWENNKTIKGVEVEPQYRNSIIVFDYFVVKKHLQKTTKISKYRELNLEEYNFANNSIFNRNLPSRENILICNLIGINDSFIVSPLLDGRFLINAGEIGYENPMNLGRNTQHYQAPGNVFVHLLTHVFQAQKLKLSGSGLFSNFACQAGGFLNLNCISSKHLPMESEAVFVEKCLTKRALNIANVNLW